MNEPVVILPHATAVSLDLPAGMPFEQWYAMGATQAVAVESLQWGIGDWLKYGLEFYPETEVLQAVGELFKRAPKTVQNWLAVAKKIPAQERRAALTWSHHAAVSGLNSAEREQLYDEAEKGDWDAGAMRAAAKEKKDERRRVVSLERATTKLSGEDRIPFSELRKKLSRALRELSAVIRDKDCDEYACWIAARPLAQLLADWKP